MKNRLCGLSLKLGELIEYHDREDIQREHNIVSTILLGTSLRCVLYELPEFVVGQELVGLHVLSRQCGPHIHIIKSR